MISRILLLALVLQTASKALPNASIEGVVVPVGTNEPIADARVLLLKPGGNGLASPIVTTGNDGKFVFKNIEPGSYLLGFTANGYVRQEYGQRILTGKGAVLGLAAGQAMKDIVMLLTPAGSVSGRILDADRNPLAGVLVQLRKYGYDSSGQQILRTFGTAQTDDRGEYRIFFVTPGRYYVSAGTAPGPRDTINRNYGRNVFLELYSYEFYPGVADARQARFIDVRPGADVGGIDLSLRKLEGFRVRGRVVDSTTGKVPENVRIQLLYRDPSTGEERWMSPDTSLNGERGFYENGEFEFRGVIPGAYAVSAFVYAPYSEDHARENLLQATGSVPIRVANADVNGILITMSRGASIPGRIIGLHPEIWNVATCRCPPNPQLLMPSSMGMSPTSPVLPRPFVSSLESDGTFHLENVMPGEYRLAMERQDFGTYIKEARFGGVDILNQSLKFSGTETGPLEIVIGSSVGSVDGRVLGAKLEAMAGAQVVLVPDRNRGRAELFRAVTADQDGRFSIEKIAPGDYRLFAWEGLEPYGYFDPEFLRQAEPRGIAVHVGDLVSKQSFDLKVISAP